MSVLCKKSGFHWFFPFGIKKKEDFLILVGVSWLLCKVVYHYLLECRGPVERKILTGMHSDRSMGPLNNIPWHQTSFHPVQHRNRWLMISCFVYFWLLGTCEDDNKQQMFPVLTKFVAPGTPAFSNWVNLRVLHTSSVLTTILSPLFTGLWSMMRDGIGETMGTWVLILVLLDYGLWSLGRKASEGNPESLNPYFTGLWSMITKMKYTQFNSRMS